MARARNIKPGFFKNETLAELPMAYRLLFIGLWIIADREGRLEDRPKRIRMEIFPADDVDCDAGLQALVDAGMVRRYEVEGNKFIDIPSFLQHQKPHPREVPSTIPPCPSNTKAQPRTDQGKTKALSSPAECGFLNPESKPAVLTTPGKTPRASALAVKAGAALESLRVHPSTVEEPGIRGELHALCTANNVRCNAMHPQLVEWARDGVTVEQLREAIVQARITKPPEESLNPPYLAPILERVRAGRQPQNAAWKSDDQAALAKGLEVGIKPKPGEDFHTFRNRIGDAIANQARRHVA